MTMRIILTPLEPYFFGNERSFRYGATNVQKAGGYFVFSDPVPSQTTLFGALRYLGIAEKQTDYSITARDKEVIGVSSFNLLDSGGKFGKINSISPLYLLNKNGDYFLKAPFDHQNDSGHYTPYEDFMPVQTSVGAKSLPRDYNVKKETADGYVNIATSEIVKAKHIFKMVERVGIDIDPSLEVFFKKSFISLTTGYSFVFFADVEDDFPPITGETVFLGQGRSAFSVTAEQMKEPDIKFFSQASSKKVLAISDMYIAASARQLYACCSFAVTQTKDFRVFTTNYDAKTQLARFDKDNKCVKLISAGSVFAVEDEETFINIINNPHAQTTGFNNYIKGGNNK